MESGQGRKFNDCCKMCMYFLLVYWRTLVLVLAPFAFLPVILTSNDPEHRCLYVVCLMGTYWIAESLPLAVTAFLPLALFPALGVLDSTKTSMCYLKETNVMFMGGIMLAIAVEYSNLHMRIALKTLLVIGCSPKKLNGGMMFVTMFFSMWISNTAATAMMMPILEATLRELEAQGVCRMFLDEDIMTSEGEIVKKPSRITVGNFLSIAYSSSIGGIGTIIGTPPNLTLKGIYETTFPDSPGISFLNFMAYAFPIMAVTQILVGWWIQFFHFGLCRPNSNAAKSIDAGEAADAIARKMVEERYQSLGPVTFHEVAVAISFIVAVLLWFFRKPEFIKGWAELITDKQLQDGATAMIVIILMFAIPAKPTILHAFDKDPEMRPKAPATGLLTWKVCHTKVPWGMIFLLGGGFAVAEGSKASGMSVMLANSLKPLTKLPRLLVLFIVSMFASLVTDFASNVAVANVILPVLADMSVVAKWHPLYLMLPATLACSHAFSLPVGTPPNALVQSPANIPSIEYIKAGVPSSILALLPLVLFGPPLSTIVFGLNEFPAWALPKNVTANTTTTTTTTTKKPFIVLA